MGYIIAAAILALLVIGFTRKTVVVMAGLIALMFASVAVYLAYDRSQRQQVQAMNDHIRTVIAFDTTCPAETPLRLTIDNSSDRTLNAVTYDLSAYRDGHSVPLYRSRDIFSDRILPPGQAINDCHALPDAIRGTDTSALVTHPPETLNWMVENLRATF